MDRDEVRAHLGCKIDPIAAGQLEQLVRRHARNSQEARDSTASILRFGRYVSSEIVNFESSPQKSTVAIVTILHVATPWSFSIIQMKGEPAMMRFHDR